VALKLGLDGKLYRNTGVYATPAWDLIGNVKDVTLNLETGEADVSTRGNNGWRATVGTLKDASIEFDMIWDTGDADFTAIKDAFFNGTTVDLAVMDGLITGAGSSGSQGLRAVCRITTFSRNEALEEAIHVSVTAKPTYSVNPPAWMVIP
jgi:Phage tail tube protein